MREDLRDLCDNRYGIPDQTDVYNYRAFQLLEAPDAAGDQQGVISISIATIENYTEDGDQRGYISFDPSALKARRTKLLK